MDTTFDILGLTGHAYGLCATAAALAVLAGIAAVARHRHLPVATAGVFGLVGIPLGIACARILYCLVPVSYTHLDVYKRQEHEDGLQIVLGGFMDIH